MVLTTFIIFVVVIILMIVSLLMTFLKKETQAPIVQAPVAEKIIEPEVPEEAAALHELAPDTTSEVEAEIAKDNKLSAKQSYLLQSLEYELAYDTLSKRAVKVLNTANIICREDLENADLVIICAGTHGCGDITLQELFAFKKAVLNPNS